MKRSALFANDLASLKAAAARAHPDVTGLETFRWIEADPDTTTHGWIVGPDQQEYSVRFDDLVAVEDGVFIFGWDEALRCAVWKWQPAQAAEEQEPAG